MENSANWEQVGTVLHQCWWLYTTSLYVFTANTAIYHGQRHLESLITGYVSDHQSTKWRQVCFSLYQNTLQCFAALMLTDFKLVSTHVHLMGNHFRYVWTLPINALVLMRVAFALWHCGPLEKGMGMYCKTQYIIYTIILYHLQNL